MAMYAVTWQLGLVIGPGEQRAALRPWPRRRRSGRGGGASRSGFRHRSPSAPCATSRSACWPSRRRRFTTCWRIAVHTRSAGAVRGDRPRPVRRPVRWRSGAAAGDRRGSSARRQRRLRWPRGAPWHRALGSWSPCCWRCARCDDVMARWLLVVVGAFGAATVVLGLDAKLRGRVRGARGARRRRRGERLRSARRCLARHARSDARSCVGGRERVHRRLQRGWVVRERGGGGAARCAPRDCVGRYR